MLQWFRVRASAVATAALVAFVALGGLTSSAHASSCHDDACAFGLAPHDASSHSIASTQSPSPASPHCVLCHWTRMPRPSAEPVHLLAGPDPHSAVIPADASGTPTPVQAAQPPLRSPPLPAHSTHI